MFSNVATKLCLNLLYWSGGNVGIHIEFLHKGLKEYNKLNATRASHYCIAID